jgi:hypothetical protein
LASVSGTQGPNSGPIVDREKMRLDSPHCSTRIAALLNALAATKIRKIAAAIAPRAGTLVAERPQRVALLVRELDRATYPPLARFGIVVAERYGLIVIRPGGGFVFRAAAPGLRK